MITNGVFRQLENENKRITEQRDRIMAAARALKEAGQELDAAIHLRNIFCALIAVSVNNFDLDANIDGRDGLSQEEWDKLVADARVGRTELETVEGI